MPEIPTFDAQPAAPTVRQPLADAAAFTAPGNALAQGGAQIGNFGAEWESRYADAKRQADAANISADAEKAGYAAATKWRLVPNRDQAQAGFDSDWKAAQQAALAQSSDPLVQSYVRQRATQQGLILRSQVGEQAFHLEAGQQSAVLDQQILDSGNRIAGNADPLFRAHEIDGVLGSLRGAEAAGWISPDEAQRRGQQYKFRISQDDAARDMETNPAATVATLRDPGQRAQAYPYLTPEWADMFVLRHSGQAAAAQARGIVQDIFPSPVQVPPQYQDMVHSATTGLSVPPNIVAAVAQHESGWDPNSVSATGATGLGNVLPSTARAPGFGVPPIDPATLKDPATNLRFTAQYLDGLGKSLGVTDWNDPAQVQPVLERYNGEPNKAEYAQAVLHMAGLPAGRDAAGQYPDEDALAQKVIARTQGNPELQAHALAQLQHQINGYRVQTAGQRTELEHQIGDIRAALTAGVDVPIPEDRIRQYLPPAQAQDLMQDLSIRGAVGKLVAGLQFASPEDVQNTVDSLSTGTGTAATMLDLRLRKVGLIAEDGGDGPAVAAGFKVREAALGQMRAVLAQRQLALASDPAGYAASEPTVSTARAAIDPANPQTFEAYARATQAVQAHLGVPDGDQRVLAAGQAKSMVQQLTSADPAKTDVGGQIGDMEQSYGGAWPAVWHDLVRDGKIPPEYQVLAQMQPGAERTQMQRALQVAATRGGVDKLRADIDPQTAQTIDHDLDGALDEFRQTVMIPGIRGASDVFNATRSAVKALSYWNALNGQAPGTALQNAVQAALPYDFNGSASAPRGTLPAVQANADAMLRGLKPDDLADVQGGAGILDPDKRAAYLSSLQRGGQWLTNERGDGWYLAARDVSGAWQVPQRAAGGRIEFKFKGAQANTGVAAAPQLDGP